jgi:hypothetical protein
MGAEASWCRRRASSALVATFLLASCSAYPVPLGAPQALQFGWLHGNCLAVKSPIADLPQTIYVSRDGEGGDLVEARIVSAVSADGDCQALLADRAGPNRAEGRVFYIVESLQPIDLAIAVLGKGARESLRYNQCFTSEGVNFSVSDGNRVVWEDYYYLGYDVEATCE